MGLLHVVEATAVSTDVAASADFCRAAFDFEVADTAPGGAVLLGAPGSPAGRLRLVPAPRPAAPGRWRPSVWDLGPRLLGIYSRSPAVTVARVRAAGGEAGDPVSYPYRSASMTEALARGPDGLWWTIPAAAGLPSPALAADPYRTHSELHTAVLVVADHDAAVRFFVVGGGLCPLFDGTMAGEPFERLVGMPAGASLRLTFLVGPERSPARLEIMSFRGVRPADRTDAPVGLRRLVFATAAVPATRGALVDAGAGVDPDGTLRGPAGVAIALVDA